MNIRSVVVLSVIFGMNCLSAEIEEKRSPYERCLEWFFANDSTQQRSIPCPHVYRTRFYHDVMEKNPFRDFLSRTGYVDNELENLYSGEASVCEKVVTPLIGGP